MNNKQQERDNIQVSIRIKPMFEEGKTCIRVDPNLQNTIIIEGLQQQDQKFFSFDNVADQDATQEEIFMMIGQQQASNCLEGYNGCVFVYGQTGSGKTYTMTGSSQQPGLLPRIIDYLYHCILDDQTNDPSVEYLVKCSHLEIYNEHIIDLLNPDLGNLQLREDLNKGVYVEYLTEECCVNLVEAMEVLQRGNENRHISSTQMNFESSRSHSVFTIQLESRRQSHQLTNHRFSRFHFVDLAGSERQKHTQVQGERLREGCQINRSLHILGNVINSLVEDKEQNRYVHYRDSKLTFLLKDSLGGNSRTHLIATIQQSNLFYQETLSTLMFSKRVKQVKNKARVNEDESGSLESLKNEIKRLKQELAKWIVTLSNNPSDSPNKVNNVIHNMNFQDLVASDSRYIKLEEILKVYLEQSTESETALYVEIEKYLSGIKELREAFQLSSQLEQQLKLIIRLQNEQIIRLKHSNGIEDLSNDYEQELSKALLSQAAVMKKFSDSLRLKEGSAKTVEKAKLQINENVQLLNTIVSTVNGSLEERKKFQKQLQSQLAQDFVPAQEFSLINQQLQMKQQQEEQIKKTLDQIGIQLEIQDEIKIIDHKQRDLTLGQQNEQLEIKSRALDAVEKQVIEKTQQLQNLEEIKNKVLEDYQKLEQEAKQTVENLEKLQEIHNKQSEDLLQLEKINLQQTEQLEQFQLQNTQLNEDMQQLEDLNQEQNQELEKQIEINTQIVKQNIELQEIYNQQNEELKKQFEIQNQLVQQNKKLEETNNQQDEELRKKDDIIKNLNQDYQLLNIQLDKQNEILKNLQDSNAELQQKIQEKDEFIEQLNQDFQMNQDSLNNKILQLNKEIQILKEIKLAENENQITELSLQIQNIQNEKEIQLESVEQNYSQQIEQIKQDLELNYAQKESQFKEEIKQIQQQAKILEKSVQQLKQEIAQKVKQIEELEENREAQEYEIDQIKTDYEVKLEQQLEKLNQLEEVVQTKEAQIQELNKQVEHMQDEIEEVKTEAENKLLLQEEQIKELQSQVDQLAQGDDVRMQEIQEQDENLKELEQVVVSLKQENEQLQFNQQQLEETLQQQEEQITKQTQELIEKKEELLTVQQKLVLKEQEMQSQIEEACFELRGAEIPEKEQMIFELKAEVEQKDFDLQQQNEDFMKQQNVLFEIITQKDQEVIQMQESLNDHAQRLSEASKVIEKYSTCNAELQSNLDHLNKQIEKYQQQINELQNKCDVVTSNYEEKINQLNDIIRLKQQEIDFAKAEEKTKTTQDTQVKQQLDKKLKEFDKEKQVLQEEILTKEKQLQTLENKLQSSQKEKDQINNQLKTATKDFLSQLSISNQGIEEQKIWVLHYKKEVDKLNKEVALSQQIQQQYNNQRNELDQFKLENQKIHKMLESAQQQMNQYKREIDLLKQDKIKQIEQVKGNEDKLIELEELKLEKQIIQTKLNEAQRTLNESQQKLHSQQNQYQQMQEDLQLSKKEIQDIKQKNKALAQQQQTEIQKFNDEIIKIQEELEQSRKIQMEIKKAEQESKEQNVQIRQNNEKLRNENNILRNHLNEVEDELEMYKQEIIKKEEIISKQQDQLKYKQSQLENSNTIINQVEQNKLNQTNQILQQSNQLTNLSKELFALKQQLQINETQNDSYKREVDRLRREFEFQVKQVEDYKQQNKKIQQQLDFEKKHSQKQKIYEASELLSKIDSTLSPIKGNRLGSTLYGSSDSKNQQRFLQQRTPQKEYGIQNSNSASMLNTSFQSQDQLTKENKKLKASLEQKMKIIEQLEQALIQSEQTLKEVHEKANQFCQQQEDEIKQIKEQYSRLEQEHNTILAEREYENQEINKQKEQALFKVQILQDEVLKSKRGSIASQHVASSKYSETLQDISIRDVPSSSHRYRQSDGQFKSYFGADQQAKLIYDTQKLLLENQKLNSQMCKLYQILGLDKSRTQKLGDGDKIIQSVQLLLQEVIDCKQEIQNLIQAQPARSLKYQSMEKELLQTKQKYYAVDKSPKFWNNETPKARFFNYSNSSGK